jgi:hypothetical protein
MNFFFIISAILNTRNNEDAFRENFQQLQKEMQEKSEECLRLQKRVAELEMELSQTNEVKTKENSRIMMDQKSYESMLEKYKIREKEHELTIKNLRRSLENELIEKSSKDGLLMLRGALIGALQEKEVSYKNRIDHLETKLADAHRQVSEMKILYDF